LNALANLTTTAFKPQFFKLRWAFELVLVALAFLAITNSTTAQAKEVRWNNLHLTSQQETRINRLEDRWQQTHSEVSAQIDRDRNELRNLLPSGDTQRIRAIQNRIISNKMYLMNESMNIFLQKRDLLSPDQRAQLQKMIPNSASIHALSGSN